MDSLEIILESLPWVNLIFKMGRIPQDVKREKLPKEMIYPSSEMMPIFSAFGKLVDKDEINFIGHSNPSASKQAL